MDTPNPLFGGKYRQLEPWMGPAAPNNPWSHQTIGIGLGHPAIPEKIRKIFWVQESSGFRGDDSRRGFSGEGRERRK